VLVGGGDATISALPVGSESFYKGAPKMIDLATQVMAARGGEPVTEVVLDASYWNSADRWDPAWKRTEQTIGYHSEVTALQVDGDRADPTKSTSPRSTDPIGRAGAAFIAALAEAGNTGDVAVTEGTAVSTTVLGEVKSQPLSVLINQMLLVSDNTLAEMIARVTSKASGLDGSAASLQQAIPSALTIYGVDVAGIVIKDGSGLSEFNSVPPSYVAQLMIKVLQGGQNLNFVYAGLPVAGKSGSLASRFSGANAIARGAVVAKTGWIDTAYSLAGIVTAADTTPLTFAFYAIGDVSNDAKEALDTLTTAVFSCGDNLSNN
jgi:D-alanyl-D-alanine carboxypeptidase/D-alanyl-D-alanine-endopeptidase (penicillin-binding protein 4)